MGLMHKFFIMAFKDEILTFESNKILNEVGLEVMMDWETPIMQKLQSIYLIIREMCLR